MADGVAAYRDAVELAEREFMRDTVLAARAERDLLISARAALEALTNAPTIREADEAGCGAALAGLVAQRPGALFAALTDRQGIVVCASRPDAVGVDISGSEAYANFRSLSRFAVNTAELGQLTGRRVIVASVPIFEEGQIEHAIHLSFQASFMAAVAAEEDEADESQEHYALIDRQGAPLMAARPIAAAAWLPEAGWAERLRPWSQVIELEGRDGVERLYAAAPLLDDEVWLLGGAPADIVRRGSFAVAAPAVIGPALMWLAGVFVAYFTIDRLVVRHVVYLSRLARAFGHGRLRLRPRGMERAPAEVARLAADMSEMAGNLDARQKALEAAAETNRVLLLEVYHRVKNNLQMIASLLAMEGRRAKTAEERETLERVRSRVQSVALVHAMLYGGEDVSRVRLDRLTEQILRPLESARDRAGGGDLAVSLTLDPVLATAERATPYALFLNEAGSNAILHARSTEGPARIEVSLRAEENGGFALTLANDVVGADGATEEGKAKDALGRRLMEGFAQQLGAAFSISREEARHVVRLTAPPGRAFARARAH